MRVQAILTPSTAQQVAAAIFSAYRDLRGYDPPSKSSWLWPLALSSNETAQWIAMYNRNAGNVTTSGDAVPWYLNPKVTAPLRFRSFDDLRSGALAMLKALDLHGGVVAADAGDKNAWQAALNGYLGSPYPQLWNLIDSLNGSISPVSTQEQIRPPSTSSGSVAVAVGLLALVGGVGYGLYRLFETREPEPEPWVPGSMPPSSFRIRRVAP